MNQQFQSGDITSDDKLMSALSYGITILMPLIILLFMADKKNRPFIKAHLVQSLIAGIAINLITFIISIILGVTVILALCAPIVWLAGWAVMLYWAYQAYQGKYITIPVITNLVKQQGWA